MLTHHETTNHRGSLCCLAEDETLQIPATAIPGKLNSNAANRLVQFLYIMPQPTTISLSTFSTVHISEELLITRVLRIPPGCSRAPISQQPDPQYHNPTVRLTRMRAFVIALVALPLVASNPIPATLGVQSTATHFDNGAKVDARLGPYEENAHQRSDPSVTQPSISVEYPLADFVTRFKNSFGRNWLSTRDLLSQPSGAPRTLLPAKAALGMPALTPEDQSTSLLIPRTTTPKTELAFTKTQKECQMILKSINYEIMRAPQKCRDLQHASTRFFEVDTAQDKTAGDA